MKTTHTIFFQDSSNLDLIPSKTIDLIVTSPPYPMIEMWDDIFSSQNNAIAKALNKKDGHKAFELMHKILDSVWDEIFRVLKTGGFACINIADATRTINSNFAVYSNHSRILQYLVKLGFSILPEIIWRKQTNAPNKFMGSGMLPAGAYVTLEHEYILIVRKGGKREFKSNPEKLNRRQSAIFWEERNTFFSDIWFDIKGTRQGLIDKASRDKSAAFPFELAYRLINMYSVKGDNVLDPFVGTGTTMAASMASARNTIGFEIDNDFNESIPRIKENIIDLSNQHMENRLKKHLVFVDERIASDKLLKHKNIPYGFPVTTNQEKELILNELLTVEMMQDHSMEVTYSDHPQTAFCRKDFLS
ncbi:DNA-methyltransferase [Desulfobacula toluolica]|uniref:Methyltransferase n=1 Tax=Desulfobacula toluolica (strain DSM 7467 / Tol2) TaxID=651182 RepID=K0NJD5_DESTT|nr:site-specific DNA-methyltransferase [Desulfobacula toluolica]CCK79988.1 DNA methylase, N-4/N-6 [Desulfobacula toluolica Tol2]